MKIKYKKEELVALLEAKLPEVEAADKAALAKHYAQNKAVAKARREYLRAMAKLPDDELAERTDIGGRYDDEWPSKTACPLALLGRARNEIQWLKRDSRRTITLESTDRYGLAQWLNFGTDLDAKVC